MAFSIAGQCAHVVRRHQDHPGLRRGERGELLDRGRRAVVVGRQLGEHRGVRAAGPDRGELLAGDLDRLGHLLVGLVEGLVDHGFSPSRWPGAGAVAGADERADLLTLHDSQDVALGLHAEDDHRQVVLHAQRERGRVGHLEALLEGLVEGELVVLDRVVVGARVGAVDAVDPVLAHQHDLALGLQRALRGDGVGGEVRHPGAGAEDHDAALLEVPDRAARDVGLGDLAHGDGGLDAGLDAFLLQEVLEGQAVHHDAEHAHVVGAGTVHAALLQLGAAEEVAATGDDRDLDAGALRPRRSRARSSARRPGRRRPCRRRRPRRTA